MSSVDSWISLGEAVAATPDQGDRTALLDALRDFGLSDAQRAGLADAAPVSYTHLTLPTTPYV